MCGVCEHVLEGQAASFYHLDMFDAITMPVLNNFCVRTDTIQTCQMDSLRIGDCSSL